MGKKLKDIIFTGTAIGAAGILLFSCAKDKAPVIDQVTENADSLKTVQLERKIKPYASEFNNVYTIKKGDTIEKIAQKYLSFKAGQEIYFKKGTPEHKEFLRILDILTDDIMYRNTPNRNYPNIINYVNSDSSNTNPDKIKPGDIINFKTLEELYSN